MRPRKGGWNGETLGLWFSASSLLKKDQTKKFFKTYLGIWSEMGCNATKTLITTNASGTSVTLPTSGCCPAQSLPSQTHPSQSPWWIVLDLPTKVALSDSHLLRLRQGLSPDILFGVFSHPDCVTVSSAELSGASGTLSDSHLDLDLHRDSARISFLGFFVQHLKQWHSLGG